MFWLRINRRFFAGFLVFAWALSTHAMSLGRTQGTAWVGRPLDVGVQVKLDPGEDAASLCLAVDVLYGDTRVNSGQIRVSVEPGESPEGAVLRVQSSVPVDEPVVNLYLKAGCAQAFTRHYVILADVPIDNRVDAVSAAPRVVSMSAPERGTEVVAAPKAGGIAPGAPGIPARRAGGPFVGARQQGAMAGPTASDKAVTRAGAAKVAPERRIARKVAPPSPAPKSRLKLDTADLLIERDPVLRTSAELLSEPQDTGTRRAEAAALWRAMNASSEEILRDSQRLQALQADVVLLQGKNQKDAADIAELRSRLQMIESERVGRAWVFGLAAALAAALGATAFFWSRSRAQSSRHWWSAADGPSAVEPAAAPVAVDPVPGVSTAAASANAFLDIDLNAAPAPGKEERVVPMARPAQVALDAADFQSSLSGAGRAVRVEELLDIQQQADFFISLGQYEQAVAALRSHIADNVETSALAYLDLLKIYHLQGRRKDYALVRKEFNDLFNAEVPEFEGFDQQTRGLQSYRSAMSRIVELWPTPKVLDVIEESILRKPGQGSQVFDLEAYRELLMLYAVAKELLEDDRQGRVLAVPAIPPAALPEQLASVHQKQALRRPAFQANSLESLPVSSPPRVAGMDSHGMPLMRVPPSANLGLDIDLSELVPDLPETQPAQSSPRPGDTKAPDSHLIDFDLFDLATQAHADFKRGKS
jgi:hypothetical protein